MRELPSGTITLLFADIEQSTALVQRLGAERYAEVLARYRGMLREAVSARDGVEVRTERDAYYAAFASARQA
jgi:class 3 adenylate cyclase